MPGSVSPKNRGYMATKLERVEGLRETITFPFAILKNLGAKKDEDTKTQNSQQEV